MLVNLNYDLSYDLPCVNECVHCVCGCEMAFIIRALSIYTFFYLKPLMLYRIYSTHLACWCRMC